jgi:hypothetical protein
MTNLVLTQLECNKLQESIQCVPLYKKSLGTTGLEYAIRRVQENQEVLKLNETHQLLAYVDDVKT